MLIVSFNFRQYPNMRSVSLYSISSGFEKGLFFLLPLLAAFFISPLELGELTLTITTLKLLSPVFSLNGSASIIRYGTNSSSERRLILIKYLGAILFFIALYILSTFFTTLPFYLNYGLALGLCEACFLLLLAFIRASQNEFTYLLMTLLKFITYLLPSLYGFWVQQELSAILEIIAICQLVVLVPTFLLYLTPYLSEKISKQQMSFVSYVLFSMSFYVHSLSQWIINSGDRYLIPLFLDKTELGKYSIMYSFSMPLLILSAGLGLYLPLEYTKSIQNWQRSAFRSEQLKKILLIAIPIGLIPLAICIFNNHYLEIFLNHISTYFHLEQALKIKPLSYIDQNFIIMSGLISSSFIFLLSYHFFASFFFYAKKGLSLTRITLIVGLLNIILNILGLPLIGIWASALATWICYLTYYLLVRKNVSEFIPQYQKNEVELWVPLLASLSVFLPYIFYTFLTFGDLS